jgi:hypothetical protein
MRFLRCELRLHQRLDRRITHLNARLPTNPLQTGKLDAVLENRQSASIH